MTAPHALTDLKILVVGLGSMGKRRVRNWKALGAREIWGFDPEEARRKEAHDKYGIEVFAEFEPALRKGPDAVVISTPPDWHVHYAKAAAELRKPFFMEASVVPDGMEELIALCDRKETWGAPSCTMRFYPGPQKIREFLEAGQIGKALSFTYHSGMYLPDWHPWEDYRKFYAGRRDTGAAREIVPFEMVWLFPLFGPVESVQCMRGRTGTLDVDIDDIYQILAKFKGGVFGHMQVDALARDAVRTLRILGTTGTLEWNMQTREVRVYSAESKKWETHSQSAGTIERSYANPEEPYIAEMKSFGEAVLGLRPFPYTLQEDLGILRLLVSCEESSDEGKRKTVSAAAAAMRPETVGQAR